MNSNLKISIIIPAYNTEKYLPTCLDSVCGQTLHDIDIILVDDASTDESGKICDRYAKKDPRIRVFHNRQNQSLSAVRNFGIELAREFGSEYIGFVDADDWIEPDMYEILLNTAQKTDADIVECGYYTEFRDRTTKWIPAISDSAGMRMNSTDALIKLLEGVTHDSLWNKLWKSDCFDNIIFSTGKYYNDMIVTFRIYQKCNVFVNLDRPFYHYRQTSGSIIHQHGMRFLSQWQYYREKYEYIVNVMKDQIDPESYHRIENNQLKRCIAAIGKNWVWWVDNPHEEQEQYHEELINMSDFVRKNTPFFGRKGWTRYERITCLMARFPNRFSLRLSNFFVRIERNFRKQELF